ncbi:hypothetical protein [Pseudomonas chlororaphis]|uniref:hypothetical protein n=1 Tax=Pseudomonas chlororaphis TaxID=587753 RepID=UPI0011CE2D7E|nr:hypothetical protein [Pseudomonas chlororaphis]
MTKDGMLDPVEGLNSPVGMGTLAVTLALTRAMQVLAGKNSEVIENALHDALASEIFNKADPAVRKSFEAPIRQALKVAETTKLQLAKASQS